MDRKTDVNNSPKWLTDQLKTRVRQVFEPRYNRKLSDLEVVEIAENLTNFVEHFLKFKERIAYANKTT